MPAADNAGTAEKNPASFLLHAVRKDRYVIRINLVKKKLNR
jgi:hypothetical protein